MTAPASPYRAHDVRYRERWHVNPSLNHVAHVDIPDAVTVLERDPSPCFMCGTAGACRHRPWMLAE